MSAWLCSEKHIFELAKYFVDNCQQYSSDKINFKAAAQFLYDENCESLGARYGDDYNPINIPISYKPTIDNIFVLAKQVDCYSYQSCEHDGWETSRAYKMCEAIKYNLLHNHPDYDSAPWGVD